MKNSLSQRRKEEKENKEQRQIKTNGKMVNLNPTRPISTLSVKNAKTIKAEIFIINRKASTSMYCLQTRDKS